MVHRDNLRVMPYGREDNDFFEIEKRRTKNAGQYLFSNRHCFGGVSISKLDNPNLRDKAGREGIIDNKASKIFREVIEHILIKVAEGFLGRKSQIRADETEQIAKKIATERAVKDRKKLLKKEQQRIKKAISDNSTTLQIVFDELVELKHSLEGINTFSQQNEIIRLKHDVTRLDGALKGLSLTPIPKSLGSIESVYREYRDVELNSRNIIKLLNISLNTALESLTVKDDIEIAEQDFRSKAAILHSQIRKYAVEGRRLLKEEQIRFDEQIDLANKAYHQKLSGSLDNLAAKRTSLSQVINLIESEFEKSSVDIYQSLNPYVTTLEGIRNQIDLEGLALHSVNENAYLKDEVDRVNSLAQLGIAVEIIGHEIEGLDMTIERGHKILKNSQLDESQHSTIRRQLTCPVDDN
jgi:hypothetical protein